MAIRSVQDKPVWEGLLAPTQVGALLVAANGRSHKIEIPFQGLFLSQPDSQSRKNPPKEPPMNREDKYMTQQLGYVLLGLVAIMFALIIVANVLG